MSGESLPSPVASTQPTPPSPPSPAEPRATVRERLTAWLLGVRAYFSEQDPLFLTAFAPAFVVSVLIYVQFVFWRRGDDRRDHEGSVRVSTA